MSRRDPGAANRQPPPHRRKRDPFRRHILGAYKPPPEPKGDAMPAPADWTSGGRDRGTCSVCGGNFEITKKGVVRHHGGFIRCSCSGKPPAGEA